MVFCNLGYKVYAKNNETVYSDTCINRTCSKEETLFRKTDTFDLVCFLYASFSHNSKAETVKTALLQTDFFFGPQIKKQPALPGHKEKF